MDYARYLFQLHSMQAGRAPSWNVIANVEAGTWLEATAPLSDERLLLPAELRKRVSWCSPKHSLPLLAITEADGSVAVSPLMEQNDEIEAVRAALAAAPTGSRGALAFAAMAIYARISLQPDGRLRLSPSLLRHLGGRPGAPIWVGAHDDTVRLWSDDVWANVLSSSAATLREAVRRSGDGHS